AFDSLNFSGKVSVAEELATDARTVSLGAPLLRRFMAEAEDGGIRESIKWSAPALIAAGMPGEALMILKGTRETTRRLDLSYRFNVAMASWAVTREVSNELFKDAVDAAPNAFATFLTSVWANRGQCLAMSHWAIGDLKKAAEYLSAARKSIARYKVPEMS